MSTDERATNTAAERTCLVSWRSLSEWERAPHLSEAMFAFPCKGDTRYWSVDVVCDPDVYVDCLSDEDRRSGLWALVPYPYPRPGVREAYGAGAASRDRDGAAIGLPTGGGSGKGRMRRMFRNKDGSVDVI